jgi:predicted Zn-dependent protease
VLGDIALLNGDANAALERYKLESDPVGRLRGVAIAEMKLSQVQAADAAMAELRSKYGDITYYQQAQVFAQWGRTDEALTCLEKAVAASDAGVVRSRNDPLLDPIRKTVRFASVERNLGYV